MSYCYNKLSKYFQLQEQKSHYHRIREVKKNIDLKKNQLNYQYLTTLRTNQKFDTLRDRQLRQSNVKLYNRIVSIKKKEKPSVTEHKKKHSTIGSMAANALLKDNNKMFQRLTNVKPAVGSISNWESEYKKTRQYQKRLHKFLKNDSFEIETIIQERRGIKRASKKARGRKNHTSHTLEYPGQLQIDSDAEKNLKSQLSSRRYHRGKKLNHKSEMTQLNLESKEKVYKFSANQVLLNQQLSFQENTASK